MALTCAGDGRRLAHKGREAGAGEAAHSVAAGRVSAANVGTLSAFVNIHAQSAWKPRDGQYREFKYYSTVVEQKYCSESSREFKPVYRIRDILVWIGSWDPYL
jgi:hypothetical protein